MRWRGALLMASALVSGCGADTSGGWVYYHPPPVKGGRVIVLQGQHSHGGCGFGYRLKEGQVQEEVALYRPTCQGLFMRGHA